MTGRYVGLVQFSLALSLLLPLALQASESVTARAGGGFHGSWWVGALALLLGLALARGKEAIELQARRQREAIASHPLPAGVAIALAAGLSLFLELAVVRWQSSAFPIFSFYKNFSLLACFAGLGLGYSLHPRKPVPLFFVIPLLVYQALVFLYLERLRVSDLLLSPFPEQLNMGSPIATAPTQVIATSCFLLLAFLLTALAFIPIGQLCAVLMTRTDSLAAYGWNLFGSLLGVLLMLVASTFWTPPAVWFGFAFAALMVFQGGDRRRLVQAGLASLLGMAILSWPLSPGTERIFSPYQMLERTVGGDGLIIIKAAGTYYQAVHDLSPTVASRSRAAQLMANYYNLPYTFSSLPPRRVAIVGAGSGNDVAAAVRAGATEIDAIEIDPAIIALGRLYHPEAPYSAGSVRVVTDDARTFLRNTPREYDLIAYSLLDSHTLLSHASSIRLDSFVYTMEALRESRAKLKEQGVLSLSFSLVSAEHGRKIFLMMKEAFGGVDPVCIRALYDCSIVFAQRRDGSLRADTERMKSLGFDDAGSSYGDPALAADVSTDDWPFFYMPRRVYPFSCMVALGIILAISTAMCLLLLEPGDRAQGQSEFFFLGAGFMLVEMKAITELGLEFGSTWQVVGIVICGILVMAFLANHAVRRLAAIPVVMPFAGIFLCLVLGYWLSSQGGFPSTLLGRVEAVVVLTSPLFFSGLAFSMALRDCKHLGTAMALNLCGAMAGGALEYNAMYFGFRFLYLVALTLYACAALPFLWRRFQFGPGRRSPELP